MSVVTTLLAPITQRAPIVTPLVTTTFAPQPDVVAEPRRPLAVEALPGDRLRRVVEAVVGVGDEAAVGGHAVIADLDEAGRRDHHALVQEDAAPDPDAPGVAGAVSQTPRSSSVPSPISRRPSRSSSSIRRSPATCANARRRASSRCSASRFQGSEPRWYQRHLTHHRRRSDSCRTLAHGASVPDAPAHDPLQVRPIPCNRADSASDGTALRAAADRPEA